MKRFAPQEQRTFFVTAVAWGRRSIFQTERMTRLFLDVLQHTRESGRCSIHEFVVMPNHFHALITPASDVSLEKAMQFIKGGFSFRAKRELCTSIEIWQRSFTEHRIHDAEDYQSHREYILVNPRRARLASEYPYISSRLPELIDPPPPGLKPSFYETAGSQG